MFSYVLKTTTNTQYLVLTVDMSQLMLTSIYIPNTKLHLNCDIIVILCFFIGSYLLIHCTCIMTGINKKEETHYHISTAS